MEEVWIWRKKKQIAIDLVYELAFVPKILIFIINMRKE